MRRRFRESVNLDSLLDVMMNVVGFLVVALAVLQLSVNFGVSQTERSSLRDQIQGTRDETSAIAAGIPGIRARVENLLARLADAEQPIASGPKLSTVREQWRVALQRADELDQAILAEQRSIVQIQQRIRHLEAQPPKQPDTERLPDAAIVETYIDTGSGPKPDWVRMTQISLACHRDRVFRIDNEKLIKEVKAGLSRATGGKSSNLNRAEWKKAVQYFEDHDVGDSFFRMKLGTFGRIHYEFRESSVGESIADLRGGGSRYETYLREELSASTSWLRFHVWDDSFAVYSLARSIAERKGYRVGWLPWATDQTLISGSGSERRVGPDSASRGSGRR